MNWITRILDFISPRLCVVCGQRLAPTERSLCSVCLFHLPRTDFHQKPLDNPMAQLFWGLAPIEKAAALFYYHPHSETAQLVYRLKYNNRPDIG
jgi:predicted amidophosphoribosyltransferase